MENTKSFISNKSVNRNYGFLEKSILEINVNDTKREVKGKHYQTFS